MASGTPELDSFIRDALPRASRDEIRAALRQAGWPLEQVDGALAAYADIAFPVPVPRPRNAVSAQEAFLYLLLFCTLYFSAWHLGSLLFDFINRAFPDAALGPYATGNKDSIRWSISALVIGFPVFVFVARQIAGQVAGQPQKRRSPVRRWLTYATLFLTALIVIGDLTVLVYQVLGGELGSRFALKVLTAGVIAGAIFIYYLRDLRSVEACDGT